MIVLFISFQQNVQNLKSIDYCRNQKNFCKTCKNRKNHRNSMDAVHSQGHSCQTDGPMRVLGLVFLLQGNPNAPQQVNFSIQILAHNTQHSIWETTVQCDDKCTAPGQEGKLWLNSFIPNSRIGSFIPKLFYPRLFCRRAILFQVFLNRGYFVLGFSYVGSIVQGPKFPGLIVRAKVVRFYHVGTISL